MEQKGSLHVFHIFHRTRGNETFEIQLHNIAFGDVIFPILESIKINVSSIWFKKKK